MAKVRQFDEEHAFVQALDVFWQKGFRATSMLDLAEATGVQRGSLYNAYGDKEEIFMRVFERYTAEFLAGARHALDKPDVRDALTAFFTFAIRSISGFADAGLSVHQNGDRSRPRIAPLARRPAKDAR